MTDTMPPPSDNGEGAKRLKRVGAYAKLLANYASDDAIIEAGEPAELLFVRGLAFCATSDADGYITDAQVVRYVGAGMRDALKRADRLAIVGLWKRVDGGYMVRAWTKIHETAEDKGRRRKADRERKRKDAIPSDVDADSETTSARIPDGIHAEGAPESLSMNSAVTQQRNDTTAQDGSSLGGDRYETLRVVPATEPPQKLTSPEDARCTSHVGVAEPGPCKGCRAAREKAEKDVASDIERQRREDERAGRDCDECDGIWIVDPVTKLPTRRRCGHRRTA